MKDYYDILELSKNASPNEIKSAYRKLSKKHHPDVNQSNAEAEEKFKEIGTAYEVLKDPSKKSAYDNGGAAENQGNSNFQGGFNPFDPFGGFNPFTGGFNQGNMSRPNSDLEMVIQITAEESIKPFFRTLNYEKTVFCSTCKGNGGLGNPETCKHCNGRKFISVPFVASGMTMVQETPCPICKGKGIMYPDACTSCNDFGLVKTHAQVTINLPHPVAGRQKTYENMGNYEDSKIKAGNLHVVFQILPHDKYNFQNYDCIYEAKINPVFAIMGGEIKVPTLDGVEVNYKVPKKCEVNYIENVGNYGLYTGHGEDRAGLWVKISYDVKDDLSPEQERILQSYLDTLNA